MNTKGRTQGQLILVAGFLVAIAIIGVAMTLSGVFFTQNVDESGLSQFESSATSQQASADVAANRGLSLTNLMAERRGLNGSNLTKSLINYMKNYTRTTQNVSQLQAVVNVSLDNSSLNQSWVSGMKKAGVLPGWTYNITETENRSINVTTGRSPFDIVYTLDTSGSMGQRAVEDTSDWEPNGSYVEDPDGYADPEDGDAVCSAPSSWDDCQIRLVQGDDPANESARDVDSTGSGDIVRYDAGSNEYFAEVQAGPNGSGEYQITYETCSWNFGTGWVCTDNTEWVDESTLEDWDIQYRYIEYSSSDKIDVAQEATKKAVGAMNESDRAGLVQYSGSASKEYPSGAVVENMTATEKSNLNSTIDGLTASGGTNIPSSLDESVSELMAEGDNSDSDADYIVLLSDGKNTLGPDGYDGQDGCNYHPDSSHPSYHDVNPSHPEWDDSEFDGGSIGSDPDTVACDETLQWADTAASNNIKIFTISFGSEADQELMQEIADRTNGTHMVADSGDLVDILQEIIGDIKDEQPPQTETRTVHEPTLSEPIEKIYDLRLQVQNFTNQESISVNITNTTKDPVTGNNTTRSVWKYTVNNTGPSGYEVSINSDFDSSINKVQTIPDDINDSDNNVTLTMDFDNNVFKVDRNETSQIFDLSSDADVIKDNSPVSFSLENGNKSAKGTFRFEFLPVGGSLDSGSISGLCSDNGTTTCGTNDDPLNGTYSTARTRQATVSVSYNSAQGDYENEIEVDAD